MRIVILLLWLLLGFFYYHQATNSECCNDSVSEAEEEVILPVTKPAKMVKNLNPISFECKDDKADLSSRWENFRDSLINAMGTTNVLEIKGFEFSSESDNDLSLALRRATNVRKLFNLPEKRIKLASANKGKDCDTTLMSQLIAFRVFRNSNKIVETKDGITIYFTPNSTNKLDDGEVEAYLDDVAKRVKKSGESIRLTGHTDNIGEESDNFRLGQARANIIRNYLISKGVSSRKIKAGSKGEAQPIAPNNTADGRQKNRRTELQIFK